MLIAVLNLCIIALVILLVLVLIEWIAKKFSDDIPANVFLIVRAIAALIFLTYAVTLLLGGGEAARLPWRFP